MNSRDSFETQKPVAIVDRCHILPGNQQAVYELMTRDYAAHVLPRGLRLIGVWLSPPFDRPDAESELVLVWEYESLPALWAVRMAEETDPVDRRIWADLGRLTSGRSRQLARSAPMELPAPDESGRIRVAVEHGRRSILFVRPAKPLSAAERSSWIAAAEGVGARIPSLLVTRAGFHQAYSFMPDHFTWDVTTREPPNYAELLESLPAAAEIVDAVELGPVINTGIRAPHLVGTKRTILVRLKAGLTERAVAEFEKVLAATPRYITAIRNWRLSRVSSSRGAVAWTHCFEQEVPDAAVFVGDYLNHPYHWAVVERLFHPDAPERSADGFCHTLYPMTRSVLAEVAALRE